MPLWIVAILSPICNFPHEPWDCHTGANNLNSEEEAPSCVHCPSSRLSKPIFSYHQMQLVPTAIYLEQKQYVQAQTPALVTLKGLPLITFTKMGLQNAPRCSWSLSMPRNCALGQPCKELSAYFHSCQGSANSWPNGPLSPTWWSTQTSGGPSCYGSDTPQNCTVITSTHWCIVSLAACLALLNSPAKPDEGGSLLKSTMMVASSTEWCWRSSLLSCWKV